MARGLRRRSASDPMDAGRRLVVWHGLRASAVAAEYAAQAQAAGDIVALHRARQLQAAVAEYRAEARRTASRATDDSAARVSAGRVLEGRSFVRDIRRAPAMVQ